MSEFEFISVAVALVYSFAVARLVTAVPVLLGSSERYWVHAAWALHQLLGVVVSWWFVFELGDVSWTPLRYLVALSLPSLAAMRIAVLVTDSPSAVGSWRAHFYDSRIPFFTFVLIGSLNAVSVPWSMGQIPWFEWNATTLFALIPAAIAVIGLATARPWVHGLLVSLNSAVLVAFFATVGTVIRTSGA